MGVSLGAGAGVTGGHVSGGRAGVTGGHVSGGRGGGDWRVCLWGRG